MALTKGIVAGGNYTFSAANQTITFSSDYLGMSLSDVTYITNIKSGVATVIYDPFDPLKGGTLTGLVLTLAYNTVAMADDDPLQIIVGFTPNNATPQNVNVAPNSQLESQKELLQTIADNTDLLAASVDGTEGIQVNVREISQTKKDVQNAIVPSDAPAPIVWSFPTPSADYVIDTTGYQQLVVYAIATSGSWNGSLVIQGRNDTTSAFLSIPYIVQTNNATAATTYGTQTSITVSGVTVFINCAFRYIRIQNTSYTSGSAICTAYLRQIPLPTGPFTQLPVTANITQYNSTTVATAQQVGPTGLLSSAGNFAIGSQYVATSNPPNAASVLATGVPYPHAIGGREQPYIGAISGIYRHITVDGGGRYILGGDTPDTETRTQSKLASGAIPGIPPRGVGGISNNMIGAQSLTVADVSQAEGDTNTMLLKQILQELKILNQQIIEIPFLLNMGENTMSDPQEYRDDKSTLF